MADRLTQLQEAVNQMAEYFCNSVGVLQQDSETTGAADGKLADKYGQDGAGGTGSGTSSEGNAGLFSSLISRTAQDIEILIDSLPDHEASSERQMAAMKRLEMENQQCADRLMKVTAEAELLLERVRKTIKHVNDTQLGLQTEQSSTKS